MTALAVERTTGKGRQPAAVETQRDLRDELHAQSAEGLSFAERVYAIALHLNNHADRPDVVVHFSGELAHRSARRIRQLGVIS